MRTLLLATSNEGKCIEIREGLDGMDIAVLALADLDHIPEKPEETGATFRENAIRKARHYHEHSGLPTVADDSGILVEALGDELGLHTRRWGAGPGASDAEWIAFLLERMRNESNKRACFVCHLAFVGEEGTIRTFGGRCPGAITDGLEAAYLPGLPISACFRPDGCDRVFSALSPGEKNRISHRGKAVKRLREFLSGTEGRQLHGPGCPAALP